MKLLNLVKVFGPCSDPNLIMFPKPQRGAELICHISRTKKCSVIAGGMGFWTSFHINLKPWRSRRMGYIYKQHIKTYIQIYGDVGGHHVEIVHRISCHNVDRDILFFMQPLAWPDSVGIYIKFKSLARVLHLRMFFVWWFVGW